MSLPTNHVELFLKQRVEILLSEWKCPSPSYSELMIWWVKRARTLYGDKFMVNNVHTLGKYFSVLFIDIKQILKNNFSSGINT